MLCLLSVPADLHAAGRSGRIRVVASFLPIYVFAANVAGENAELSLLVPPGTDVHEFSLRPQDVKALEEADLVLINGAGIETGILGGLLLGEKLVDTSKGTDLIMAGRTTDPHVWLDPLGALRQVENIEEALSVADPENASSYRENKARYAQRLIGLHREFEAGLSGVSSRRLITYHESFNYLARRYGLSAFSLTGPGAELPLPQRVREVYDIVRKEGARAVFEEEQFSKGALGPLARDLGVRLCRLDTIESGTPEPDYYERAMRRNIETISRCLR